MIQLYKRDRRGKVITWIIENDNKSYWTTTGDLGGQMTTTAPTFCEAKNVGRANETTVEQQVLLEVESKVKKQYDLGYIDSMPSETRRFDVSLANKYIDRVKKNKLDFPYIFQPKLDGIRAYLSLVNGKIVARSRNHKEIVSVPHILCDPVITRLFEAWPDLILDGELYNHELHDDFNKICSIIAKKKLKREDVIASKRYIRFNCFDCYFQDHPELKFKERNDMLFSEAYEAISCLDDEDAENVSIDFVSSIGISVDEFENCFVNSQEEVEQKIKEYIDLGFEGIMLKKDTTYNFGRSNELLKYKFFIDSEYEITGFEEGKGNLAGIATTVICVDERGVEFRAGTTGTEEYRRYLLDNPLEFIGKLATIKYQELTPIDENGEGGVPRFGKMTSVRDYE